MRSALAELKRSKEDLIAAFSKGSVSTDFPENHTEILDQYFRCSLEESKAGQALFKDRRPFALVAVGGYGRRELCLHSDIDILILFEKRLPSAAKGLAEEVFYPLWDLGLSLGHGTRSVKDCLDLSRDDFQVLTSMVDARFICGNSPLYLSLMERLQKKVVSKKARTFAKWLKEQDRLRMETFGDASYLLEPNLKEGIGGLRGYHHLLWLGRAFYELRVPRDLEYHGTLSHREYETLMNDLDFIWLVRNHLHLLSGREYDRVTFEFQEQLARQLGFQDQKALMAVEQFLGRLHGAMGSIKALHRAFLSTHVADKVGRRKESKPCKISDNFFHDHGEINFYTAEAIPSKPHLLVDVFEQSSRTRLPLSLEAKRLVKEFRFLVDSEFKVSPDAVRKFLGALDGPAGSEALDQMTETGFLDAFIPEFGRVKDRVQFDMYHVFPVGRHVIETVRHLKSLASEKEILLIQIFADLANAECLYLAGLFHDIGKVGEDHAVRGASITRHILKRFAFDKQRIDDIVFLVRHHLLLAETATRRDLNDEKTVVQCARIIGDVERLKMLYVLTWADSKATGPRAWNEWVGNLVQELFFKLLHILESGELANPTASQRVKRIRSTVRRALPCEIDPTKVEEVFEVMTPRYLLNTPPKDIAEHVDLIRRLNDESKRSDPSPFALKAKEDVSEGWWEITFVGKDRAGLFADIAGVFALNNINILSAEIYTWRDGTVVDIFKVTRPLDPIFTGEVPERLKKDFRSVFRGRLSLTYRLGQKAAPSILTKTKRPPRSPVVNVNNAASDFFTLIEVFSDDRMGLLYLITHTLTNLRLDIRIAKIATKGDQIADVFYVRDLEGQKVEDDEHIEEIRRTLLFQLEQKWPLAAA
jgi:[protein-PII] uridylyltransferase